MTVALGAMFGDQAAAEDAVGAAIVRCLEALDDGQEIESIERWVFVVARNLERSRLTRGDRPVVQVADNSTDERDDIDALVEHDRVVAALEQLPQRQREVAVARYYLGYSVSDVAELLSSTESAVKNALFHARNALRTSLKHPDPEEVNNVD